MQKLLRDELKVRNVGFKLKMIWLRQNAAALVLAEFGSKFSLILDSNSGPIQMLK